MLPLHPGARIALARFGMDELGVARAIAAGELTSPQHYENVWLFAIRITGTGAAYRAGLDEYCWRDPSIYLNDEFLARCNGLPVIFEHPDKKPMLDTKEFNDRIVGTVLLPYISGNEVWGVAKIYDEPTASLLLNEQFSTSPAVVFRDLAAANTKLKLDDGSTLLIEGKPALLDHIALCSAGVWDKGGPPTGVISVGADMADESKAAGETDANSKLDAILGHLDSLKTRMDAYEARKDAEDKAEREEKERVESEERERTDRAKRHDAARKGRFGARKDGESDDEYKERHDADETAMMDELEKGGEEKEAAKDAARRARKDAEESAEMERSDSAARKDLDGYMAGGEFHPIRNSKGYAKSKASGDYLPSKKRHDAASKDESFGEWASEEEREAAHRKDATMHQENEALKARLAALEGTIKQLTSAPSHEERDALAAAQGRADGVAVLFGDRAPSPNPGESSLAYRRRLAARFQKHSARFKDARLDGLDHPTLSAAEDVIYADAVNTSRNAVSDKPGVLFPTVTTDPAGRQITTYHGDIMAFMAPFMTGAQRGRFIRKAT